MSKSNRAAVQAFLDKVVACVKIDVVPQRHENIGTLFELGITAIERVEAIRSLTVEHYSDGPSPDRDGQLGDFWMFGRVINNREVYIKLKVFELEGILYGRCVSFHFPKRTITYPFGGQ